MFHITISSRHDEGEKKYLSTQDIFVNAFLKKNNSLAKFNLQLWVTCSSEKHKIYIYINYSLNRCLIFYEVNILIFNSVHLIDDYILYYKTDIPCDTYIALWNRKSVKKFWKSRMWVKKKKNSAALNFFFPPSLVRKKFKYYWFMWKLRTVYVASQASHRYSCL